MGSTMSSTEPNSRYNLVLLEKLHEVNEVKLEEKPEKERAEQEEMCQASLEVWWDGLHALFPATKGELSTDQPKEEGGTDQMDDEDEDEDDQVFERFSDFMKKGGCEEPFTALVDCFEDTGKLSKCKDLPILNKCMNARISYYEPILALAKATEDRLFAVGQEQIEKRELAAENQAQAGGELK